ncbi:MAG: hypothetical protein BWY64_01045 [bacterium ADurb.Bin363]|nr:MAG: hypothetical protein BWY64_01045 [bacterium ADurb.Bin363]
MAKMWINPNFKEIYQKKDPEKKEKTDKKVIKKPQKSFKSKSSSVDKKKKEKTTPSEYYINKKIKERNVSTFKFIDNEICSGVIEWVDQRYIKIRKTNDNEGLVVEKRAIKYIK